MGWTGPLQSWLSSLTTTTVGMPVGRAVSHPLPWDRGHFEGALVLDQGCLKVVVGW